MSDLDQRGAGPEELERERDFLLRSLDDLEAERAEGGIDDSSYDELHDDYAEFQDPIAFRNDIHVLDHQLPAPLLAVLIRTLRERGRKNVENEIQGPSEAPDGIEPVAKLSTIFSAVTDTVTG